MRPRSVDRGERQHFGIRGRQMRASMRPRSVDRGERGGRRAARLRFNTASMRPRSVDRGERSTTSAASASVPRLQCGHGRLTVENPGRRAAGRVAARASMRPRSVDRGEQRRRPVQAQHRSASMRPRSVDRGEPAGRRCGRRCPLRASMRPRSVDRGERRGRSGPCRRRTALQCGHGRLTVENHHGGLPAGIDLQRLQCGHGRLTVENNGRRWRAAGCRCASMRPRSVDRGEPPIPVIGRPSAACFNAATVG